MTKQTTSPMIQVGVNKDTVQAARDAIMSILTMPHLDSKVKLKALDTLTTLCEVSNTTISNCQFTGK